MLFEVSLLLPTLLLQVAVGLRWQGTLRLTVHGDISQPPEGTQLPLRAVLCIATQRHVASVPIQALIAASGDLANALN